MSAWTYRRLTARPPERSFRLVLESHDGRAPGADSEEKHEPVSDIDTVVVDSLKALDPEWPIREADMDRRDRKCPLCANRVLTRRSKSTASLPSQMLINCTQTERNATGRKSCLGTWPTRNGLMPAGQVGELWSDFYVCQTTADVDCDQRGDVGDRETVASDKLVPA